MAAVTMFVDDAVLGRMPYVCVKTGAPAEGMLTVRTPVGAQTRLGVWWILLLLGPLGWLALLVLAVMSHSSSHGETLTVQVPWTEAAEHELDRARQRVRNLWLGAFALIVISFVFGALGRGAGFEGRMASSLFLVALALCVVSLLAGIPVRGAQIDVALDASRRWVTLGGVHDDFAHAVETSRSDHHPAAP